MHDLSKIKLLSFEIGEDCNLKKLHIKCPINLRRLKHTEVGGITPTDIVQAIDEAKSLNFNGYIAFHYYNEPMMYMDRIQEVIESRPNEKYLLWTNGTLITNQMLEDGTLNQFDKVVITCYDPKRLPFYEELQKRHKNVKIEQWELDERSSIYNNEKENKFGCKRVHFELPIDHYGNIHICCRDWNNSFEVGNIKIDGLKQVIIGERYQQAISSIIPRLLDTKNCPLICQYCDEPWMKVPEL